MAPSGAPRIRTDATSLAGDPPAPSVPPFPLDAPDPLLLGEGVARLTTVGFVAFGLCAVAGFPPPPFPGASRSSARERPPPALPRFPVTWTFFGLFGASISAIEA